MRNGRSTLHRTHVGTNLALHVVEKQFKHTENSLPRKVGCFFYVCRRSLAIMQFRYGDRSEPKDGLESRFEALQNPQVSKVAPWSKNEKFTRPNSTFTADCIIARLRLGFCVIFSIEYFVLYWQMKVNKKDICKFFKILRISFIHFS